MDLRPVALILLVIIITGCFDDSPKTQDHHGPVRSAMPNSQANTANNISPGGSGSSYEILDATWAELELGPAANESDFQVNLSLSFGSGSRKPSVLGVYLGPLESFGRVGPSDFTLFYEPESNGSARRNVGGQRGLAGPLLSGSKGATHEYTIRYDSLPFPIRTIQQDATTKPLGLLVIHDGWNSSSVLNASGKVTLARWTVGGTEVAAYRADQFDGGIAVSGEVGAGYALQKHVEVQEGRISFLFVPGNPVGTPPHWERLTSAWYREPGKPRYDLEDAAVAGSSCAKGTWAFGIEHSSSLPPSDAPVLLAFRLPSYTCVG